MCMPSSSTPTASSEPVATPTYADASVQKASATTRQKQASLAGRDIKTSPRGLGDDADTTKKELLGQ